MRKKKNLVGAAESAEASETADPAIAETSEAANPAIAETADTTGAVEAVGSPVSGSAEVAEAVSPDDPAASARPVADLSSLTPHVKAASEMLFGAVNPF